VKKDEKVAEERSKGEKSREGLEEVKTETSIR
jgi:hypothetical protein